MLCFKVVWVYSYDLPTEPMLSRNVLLLMKPWDSIWSLLNRRSGYIISIKHLTFTTILTFVHYINNINVVPFNEKFPRQTFLASITIFDLVTHFLLSLKTINWKGLFSLVGCEKNTFISFDKLIFRYINTEMLIFYVHV